MHPDHTPDPSPEQIDAQFSRIVHHAYGGQPPPVPPPFLPPRSRRPWGRWIVLATVGVLTLCLDVGAVAFNVILKLDRGPAGQATDGTTQDPPELQRVREALGKQRTALLGGDESAYLSILDSAAGVDDRQALQRQFKSLRAMKVSEWRDSVSSPDQTGDRWSVKVISKVCFVSTPCEDGLAAAETVWQVTADAATLVDWEATDHPHPWQQSELVSASGERTVVATTRDHSAKLQAILREAERAAAVADRFAHEKRPARYVVYYAGKTEWQQWFKLNLADWTGAVAVSVSDHRYEIVLNGADMSTEAMAGHLRHELTHASTLPGRYDNSARLWWLKEGIAELAEANGAPVRHHPGLPDVADVLSASTSGFEIGEPANDAKDEHVSGAYAVAFLAVRCLSERYGERQLVDFFHAAVHEGATYAKASTDVFGADWASLSAECLDYVRSAAS